MANLILDIGNTRTKMYLFEKGSITMSAAEMNHNTEAITSFIVHATYKKTIISASALIPEYIKNLLPEAVIVSQLLHFPFTINYHTPETIGADRLALSAGASLLFPNQNVLIISAGTCITYDLLDKKSVYEGGAISPGLTIRLQSLNNYTDKLPLISSTESFDFELIGKTTKQSMQSGVYNGIVAEMDGTIDMYQSIYKDLTVLLTGGDADLFALHLKNEIFAHSNLQALGLNHILETNAI